MSERLAAIKNQIQVGFLLFRFPASTLSSNSSSSKAKTRFLTLNESETDSYCFFFSFVLHAKFSIFILKFASSSLKKV